MLYLLCSARYETRYAENGLTTILDIEQPLDIIDDE